MLSSSPCGADGAQGSRRILQLGGQREQRASQQTRWARGQRTQPGGGPDVPFLGRRTRHPPSIRKAGVGDEARNLGARFSTTVFGPSLEVPAVLAVVTNRSADARLGLEHRHGEAGTAQVEGRGEAGDSGADQDHVGFELRFGVATVILGGARHRL